MTRLHDLWRRAQVSDAASDGDLLRRFDSTGDEAAFAELVARHGPVVYGACRRLLNERADIEDAFQATFLVLVARAGSLSGVGLGPWLYRVAVWTARNHRRRSARRAAASLEANVPAPPAPPADLRLDLDAALLALPARYRVPVVLCYLQGWSRRDAALHLGCPEGTLSARLSRALVKLRKRLGNAEPMLAIAAVTVPATTADAAVRTAGLFHSSFHSAAALSPAVADLTRGVLRMFWVKKVVATGLVVLSIAAAGLGIGLSGATAQQPAAGQPGIAELKAKGQAIDAQLEKTKAEQQRLQAEKAHLEELIRQQEEMARREPCFLVVLEDYSANERPTVNDLPKIRVVELEISRKHGGLAVAGEVAISPTYLAKYLSRVCLDLQRPDRLFLRVDTTDPRYARGIAAIEEICKKAPFGKFEKLPVKKAAPVFPADGKRTSAKYKIEAPDVLRVNAYIRFIAADAPTDSNGVLRHLPIQSLTSGDHLVRPDGTIKLGQYGEVSVAGLTVEEATTAIKKHLSEKNIFRREPGTSESLVVVVDVVSFNSKKIYVITENEHGNEQVFAFPYTESETVCDAIQKMEGLSQLAAEGTVRLDRPGSGGVWHREIDWIGITKHGKTTTNYQIMSGDRIYVQSKKKP